MLYPSNLHVQPICFVFFFPLDRMATMSRQPDESAAWSCRTLADGFQHVQNDVIPTSMTEEELEKYIQDSTTVRSLHSKICVG